MAIKHPAIKALDEYEQWLTNEVTLNSKDEDLTMAFTYALSHFKEYRRKFNT
jgi:hypothetical protein